MRLFPIGRSKDSARPIPICYILWCQTFLSGKRRRVLTGSLNSETLTQTKAITPVKIELRQAGSCSGQVEANCKERRALMEIIHFTQPICPSSHLKSSNGPIVELMVKSQHNLWHGPISSPHWVAPQRWKRHTLPCTEEDGGGGYKKPSVQLFIHNNSFIIMFLCFSQTIISETKFYVNVFIKIYVFTYIKRLQKTFWCIA